MWGQKKILLSPFWSGSKLNPVVKNKKIEKKKKKKKKKRKKKKKKKVWIKLQWRQQTIHPRQYLARSGWRGLCCLQLRLDRRRVAMSRCSCSTRWHQPTVLLLQQRVWRYYISPSLAGPRFKIVQMFRIMQSTTTHTPSLFKPAVSCECCNCNPSWQQPYQLLLIPI